MLICVDTLLTHHLLSSTMFACFLCSVCVIQVLRDTKERGRDLDQVLNQYINFVKPAFEEFTLPVSKAAVTMSLSRVHCISSSIFTCTMAGSRDPLNLITTT